MNGKSMVVILNGTTVTQNHVVSCDREWTIALAESTGAGDEYKTFIPSQIYSFTFSIVGWSSDDAPASANSLRAAVYAMFAAAGHTGAFDLRPSGTTAGRRKITGTAIFESGPEGFKLNEAAGINASFKATGTVTDTAQ